MLSFVIKPLKSSIFGVFLFILVYYHLCNFGQNLDNVQNQKSYQPRKVNSLSITVPICRELIDSDSRPHFSLRLLNADAVT